MRGYRKYRNQPVVIDGERFDSKLEAKHYGEIKLREKIGEVSNVIRQPKYDLIVNDIKVGSYRADHAFYDHVEDKERVVDSKGMDTEASKLRRKLVKAIYGVDVEVWKK